MCRIYIKLAEITKNIKNTEIANNKGIGSKN